jgi:ergothioneine biosynthesis protein EgtB
MTMATTISPITDLASRYRAVRAATERLCEPLETEDYVVQAMPDTSPAKWHLAHTSWFFETLALQPGLPEYRPLESRYGFLFNSYYNTLGEQFYRPHRGLITRPTVKEVMEYRSWVDRHMELLFERADQLNVPESVIEVGLNHEQQHQELMVTDLKYLFSRNPMYPVYQPAAPSVPFRPFPSLGWVEVEEGLYEIGHTGEGFAYDNERPRHKAYVYGFELADRLVTNGEYKEFMADGGYDTATLWLSDGWYAVQDHGWRAPLYWEERDGEWWHYTLAGFRKVGDAEPLCHVSLYEADAYARWAGARLPREEEWEIVAARQRTIGGNFVDDGKFHPVPLGENSAGNAAQIFGDVWEWTQSFYAPYPGYAPPEGALGEYNAKFMSNQNVLRGGSCATPRSHIRATYRNFFPASARWQFSGIRLAK